MGDIKRNLEFDASKGRARYVDRDWTLLERFHEYLANVAERIERELDSVPPIRAANMNRERRDESEGSAQGRQA
jgi:hypothetical protein